MLLLLLRAPLTSFLLSLSSIDLSLLVCGHPQLDLHAGDNLIATDIIAAGSYDISTNIIIDQQKPFLYRSMNIY